MSIIYVVDRVVSFYVTLIVIYVILSWFPAGGILADLRRVLASVVEPYLGLFRRFVPVIALGGGGIDISPIVAILVLDFGWSWAVRPLLAALL
ncbi:MAG: YggT family protein [Coriobacteriia bacterium]